MQISEEFYRITSKDLLGTFNASLDKYVLRLLRLYRARKAALDPTMEDLLDKLDEEVSKVPKAKSMLMQKMTWLYYFTSKP